MVAEAAVATTAVIVVALVARVKVRSGNVTVVYPAGCLRRRKPSPPAQLGCEQLAANR
jgi:hypothetical protein